MVFGLFVVRKNVFGKMFYNPNALIVMIYIGLTEPCILYENLLYYRNVSLPVYATMFYPYDVYSEFEIQV